MSRPLGVLLVTLAACSRGSPVGDSGPVAPATAAGIAPAALSARIEPGPEMPAPGASSTLGGLVVPPSGASTRPHLRDEGISVSNGSLPPEVIRRIVRQNFGRFRLCYETALRTNAGLTGDVRTRFVIEADGSVGTVSDAGSALPDAGVVTCVERAFGQLSFPALTGPSMTVTYSLSFAPAEP